MKPADSRKTQEIDWDAIPPEDLQTHLTLYVFSMRKTLTLNRKSVTVGASKFRDLDLTELPGGKHLNAHHGTLLAKSGGWRIVLRERQGQTSLNGRLLAPGEYVLNPGDCLMFNDTVLLSVRECGFGLVDRSHELEKNIVLFDESISMVDGHAGTNVYYDAARRMIIHDSWSMHKGNPPQKDHRETPVPPHIRTEKQLREFSGYTSNHYGVVEQKQELAEDVVLWLESEKVTYFDAKKHKILSLDWEVRNKRAEDVEEEVINVNPGMYQERDLRDFVRKSHLWIDHNRPNELDDDFKWISGTSEYRFLAELRHVEKRTIGGFFLDSQIPEIIGIPEKVLYRQELVQALNRDMPSHYTLAREIKYRDDMKWLVLFHESQSSGNGGLDGYEENMFRDVKLQTGKLKINGQLQSYETIYNGRARIVCHIRRDENQKIVYYDERTVPLEVRTMERLREFVKSKTKYWIN